MAEQVEVNGEPGLALTAEECRLLITTLAESCDRLRAERDQAREMFAITEEQNARALELLESAPEGWHRNSANVNAAIAVLRGDDAED